MAISTLFTQLKRPLQSNKRLFGIISIAILFIGALGISYYLYIQSKQQQVKEFKLQMLDTYYEKMTKQLDNDVLKSRSKENSEKSTFSKIMALRLATIIGASANIPDITDDKRLQSLKSCNLIKNNSKECLQLLAIRLSLDEEFDEYIIHVQKHENDSQDIRQSSIQGLDKFNDALIFSKDTFHTGIVNSITINERNYLLIGKKYDYVSSIDGTTSRDITLIGLISESRYHQMTRQLNPWVIALLCAFLLLALIGLPFFKMIFIAEDERLFSRDVILSGVSVIIGAPVLLIVFLSVADYGNNYLIDIPNKLEKMSNDIKERFEEEHRQHVIALSSIDSITTKYQPPTFNARKYLPAIDSHKHYRDQFKYLSNIDSSGKVLYHIAFIKEPPEGEGADDLKDRSYFKDMQEGHNLWYYEGNKSSFSYAMRPVVSIENNAEEAVYIKPINRGSNFLVGSTQLQSVHDPILPFGYQFAIIDEEGEVWFHSTKGKATLENFYNVSDNNKRLLAANVGRVATGGSLTYHGDTYLYRTVPLNETNLSLVVFYDIGLLRLQVSEVLSISSMAILLAGMMLLLIIIVTIYLRNPKWGLYKYQQFAYDFLIPRRIQKHQYIYLTLIFSFLLGLFCCVGLIGDFLPSSAFMASLLIIIWSYILVYFTLGRKDDEAHKISIRELALAAIVLVLNVIIISLLDSGGIKFFLLFAQMLCIFFIYASQLEKVKSFVHALNEIIGSLINIPYKYWYAFFLYSWLLLASFLPTYVFYKKSKAFDEVIWIKTNQMHFAESFANKEHYLMNFILLPPDGERESFKEVYQKHLKYGSYHTENYLEIKEEERKLKEARQPTAFRKLLWSSRPIYNEKIRKYQALIFQQSADESWQSTEFTNDTIQFRALNNYTHKTDIISNYMSLEEDDSIIGMKGMLLFFFKLIGGLSILLILYLLILFYVDRFFGFRFMYLKTNDLNTTEHGDYLKKFVKIFSDYRANSGLLIVGMPFSGKRNFARRIMESCDNKQWGAIYFLEPNEEDNELKIDELFEKYIRIQGSDGTVNEETKWQDIDVFVLENLEHNLMSFAVSRLKLKIISYLIAERKRIIITSEVYPSQILGFYQDQRDEEGKISSELASDYNAWRNILSAFPQIMLGINDKRVDLIASLKEEFADKQFPDHIVEAVAEEMGYSQFLPSLAPISMEKNVFTVKEFGRDVYYLDDQKMIMHVMNFSHGYYTDIWNSLPRRERYLLYDLAKDGFMNIKNGNSLFSLMKKGLIVWRDRPSIFNQSFRNFIISSVSKAEALSYEYKNRGEGSWGTIRVVLYLVILTVVIFLLLGKPNLLKDFETFYGALAGLGTIIPILSAVMGKSNK